MVSAVWWTILLGWKTNEPVWVCQYKGLSTKKNYNLELLFKISLTTFWEQFRDIPSLFQHDFAPVHKRSINTWFGKVGKQSWPYLAKYCKLQKSWVWILLLQEEVYHFAMFCITKVLDFGQERKHRKHIDLRSLNVTSLLRLPQRWGELQ